MKFIIFCFVLFSQFVHAWWDFDQYPEDRFYTARDRGLGPYKTISLYKTGSFALTFDDGPHPTRTPRILDILKKFDVKATFFVLTNKINNSTFPIIKRMLDEGHIVASHGPGHDRSGALSEAEWKRQTKESFLSLAKWHKLAGHEFTKFYYRFPYGDYGTRSDYHHINALKDVSRELMGDNCIHMAFWDVDTSDWVPGMSSQDVAQNMIAYNEGGTYFGFKRQGNSFVKVPLHLKHPTSGGVILLHDVHEVSVMGLEIFLDYAQQRNLKILNLPDIEEFEITKNCKL